MVTYSTNSYYTEKNLRIFQNSRLVVRNTYVYLFLCISAVSVYINWCLLVSAWAKAFCGMSAWAFSHVLFYPGDPYTQYCFELIWVKWSLLIMSLFSVSLYAVLHGWHKQGLWYNKWLLWVWHINGWSVFMKNSWEQISKKNILIVDLHPFWHGKEW